MAITPSMNEFILHWGEMGTRWGINRTVAQVHALLYLSDDPLTAEEISDTLAVARSNVSTSLRELQNWDLVHAVPRLGDYWEREGRHGLMLFTIREMTWTNQDNELVRRTRRTLIRY